MSLTKGAATFAMFHVLGNLGGDWREVVAGALRAHAFHESAGVVAEERVGWCGVDDLLDVGFADGSWLVEDRFVQVGIRTECRRVNPTMFRAHLRQREEAWCSEHNRARCPAGIRRDLKEQLTEEMLRSVAPRVSHCPLVWDVRDRVLYLGSGSTRSGDVLRDFFWKTFGLRLRPWNPVAAWVSDDLLGAATWATPADYRPGEGSLGEAVGDAVAKDREVLLAEYEASPAFVSEFYLWLWWRSQEVSEKFKVGDGGDMDVWTDDRVVFRGAEARMKSSMSGTDATATPEALAALHGGKLPCEIRVFTRRGDREGSMSLSGATMTVGGMRLSVDADEGDGHLLRYLELGEQREVLAGLFQSFAEERLRGGWSRVVREIRAWRHRDDDEGWDGLQERRRET